MKVMVTVVFAGDRYHDVKPSARPKGKMIECTEDTLLRETLECIEIFGIHDLIVSHAVTVLPEAEIGTRRSTSEVEPKTGVDASPGLQGLRAIQHAIMDGKGINLGEE